MSSSSAPDASSSESEAAPSGASACPNCGTPSPGTYCPNCGQQVDPELSAANVIGGFVREFADVERGFWPTLVGLTLRPRAVLREYLGGARRRFANPGRYLLVAAVVSYGTTVLLRWADVSRPPFAGLRGRTEDGIAEAALDIAREVLRYRELLMHAGYLVAAAFLAALLWRLFRGALRRPTEALALSGFLTGHAVLLKTVVGDLLYKVPVSLYAGGPVEGMPILGPVLVSGYVGGVSYRYFGPGWTAAAKEAFAGGWAVVELYSLLFALFFGGVAGLLWRAPGAYLPAEETDPSTAVLAFAMLAALSALPLLLHAAGELYSRFAERTAP